MQRALNISIVIMAIIAVCFTIWNVTGIKLPLPTTNTQQIVVVDLLRVEAAQRKFVAEMLKKEQGPAGMASAFRATGDIIAAARSIAPNSAIAVKQAFLYSEYRDITDKVLEELGLDSSISGDVDVDLFFEETSDIANMQEAVSKRREELNLPY